MQNNFYCSQKWWWLTVDPERRLLASCCKADQQPIDTTWLKNNNGKLFNNPTILQERQDMLDNKPVASCARGCWIPESKGIPSRRTIHQAASDRQFTQLESTPEVVEVILGSDCNMTCSYCTKRYSTAWLRDISDNGTYLPDYVGDDRFNITIDDRAIIKIGQAAIKNSPRYKLILDEVASLRKLQVLKFMGGEPFLYNGLEDIVRLTKAERIEITTGLGVNPKRFDRIVQQLPADVTTLVISAENTGELYEFNRYGNSYSNLLTNLDTIRKYGIKYKFANTICNLTVHGFKEFQDEFGTEDDYFNILIDPLYLAPSLLDPASRDKILGTTFKYHTEKIHQAVNATHTAKHIAQCKAFIVEFAKRRNLSLDIYPESFKLWIQE